MEKLIKAFWGVPDGEIYPLEYQPGDDCPPELIAGARAVGALPAIPLAPVDLGLLTPVGQGFQVMAPENEGAASNSGEVSAAGGTGKAPGGSDSDGGQGEGQDNGSTNAQEAGPVGSSAGEPAQDKAKLIAALKAAEIAFDKRWGPEKLAAVLAEGKKD